MARNIFKNKSKLILILLLVASLCFSLFAVACSKDESSTTKIPTYNYVEVDEGEIANSSFNIGTSNTSLTSFPINPQGWSLSKDADEAIINSYAKSGVVKATDEAWDELMNTFYKDSTLLGYALYKNGNLTEDDIKDEIKGDTTYNPNSDANFKPTDDQIKEYTIEKYLKPFYKNPTPHGSDDSIVYMLNNYRTKQNFGLGSSRKITSSTEIKLEKGTIAKISVWVKTQNLLEQGSYGANIRVINTFNGIAQGEYAVTNIVANDWTEYIVYVQADEQYDCTVKLALGLGYGLEGITEGTVYFDDISYELVDSLPTEINTTNTSLFKFNDKESITVENLPISLYKISLNDYLTVNSIDYFTAGTDLVDSKVNFTTTGLATSENKFSDTSKGTLTTSALSLDSPFGKTVNASKIEGIKNASITLTYDNFAEVDCEEYAIVSFYVKNNLNKLGSTNVQFNVYDMLDGKKDIVSRNVASITEVSEDWQLVSLVVKNNFVDDNDPSTTNDTARKFKIEIIVGPSALSTAQYKDDYASGSIEITTPQVAKGKIYANTDDAKEANEEIVYDLYSMFSSNASSTTSLYAGLSADYAEDTTTESYAFDVAPSDIGSILTNPANVKGYQGIEANHIYVEEDKEGVILKTETNTRVNGVDGSYAGLINSKYDYTAILPDLSSALNFTESENEKSIQPIMIYNKNADNYGFIGSSNAVAPSSYAKVSVTLRVVDNAKANIYLVNTAEQAKTILSFADFTSNGTEYKGSDYKLQMQVDNSMMEQNGWLTVEFYIATGADDKNFRVEVWNGTRDASLSSQGFVFIKNITVSTSGAFTESARIEDTFTVTGNPLYTEKINNGQAFDKIVSYKRPLTDLEIKFNNEQESAASMISYRTNYVWAQNKTFIYAVYNTIEPVEVDPYASVEEDEDTSSGCVAETDPSTFWLSFSSVLLIVALVVALVMLIIKNVIRKRKANANDAKSHYTITSRTKKDKKENKDSKVDSEEVVEEESETVESADTEEVESVEEQPTTENEEDNSYVYGDVQIFGEDGKPIEDNPSTEE